MSKLRSTLATDSQPYAFFFFQSTCLIIHDNRSCRDETQRSVLHILSAFQVLSLILLCTRIMCSSEFSRLNVTHLQKVFYSDSLSFSSFLGLYS